MVTTKPPWDPNGCWWSLGFRVHKDHNSETCKDKKDGNKKEALTQLGMTEFTSTATTDLTTANFQLNHIHTQCQILQC